MLFSQAFSKILAQALLNQAVQEISQMWLSTHPSKNVFTIKVVFFLILFVLVFDLQVESNDDI